MRSLQPDNQTDRCNRTARRLPQGQPLTAVPHHHLSKPYGSCLLEYRYVYSQRRTKHNLFGEDDTPRTQDTNTQQLLTFDCVCAGAGEIRDSTSFPCRLFKGRMKHTASTLSSQASTKRAKTDTSSSLAYWPVPPFLSLYRLVSQTYWQRERLQQTSQGICIERKASIMYAMQYNLLPLYRNALKISLAPAG